MTEAYLENERKWTLNQTWENTSTGNDYSKNIRYSPTIYPRLEGKSGVEIESSLSRIDDCKQTLRDLED